MSDKSKKFEPSTGWLVAINHQQVSIHRLADMLDMDAVLVGKALDDAGYMLTPDPFGYASDSWKVIEIEKRKTKEHLSVVEDKVEEAPVDDEQ